jgi:hypothetical protein
MRTSFIAAAVIGVVLGITSMVALGQTTTVTKTVQNPDGTYTVIEYPVGKQVVVNLDPFSITGATGTATVIRDDSGTTIKLNLTGLPPTLTSMNLYAVDDAGVASLLGPVAISNGVGSFSTTTPMSKFMLVASPETIATYDTNTKVYFRSAVPEGFAVVPHRIHPVGEQVSATLTPGLPRDAYAVPMLNIPAYKKGDDTKMKVDFTGALTGSRANVFITPRKDGPTEIKMRFHELKDAPSGQVFVLWAVAPEGTFVKLGQVVNTPGRNEAEIQSETTLSDFGLLVTMEDAGKLAGAANPFGPRVAVVEIH